VADKKISALTAASTPLAGTEVLPIVQGGSTVKVAVSDLTAGRNTGMTNAILSNGIVVQTSAVNRWIIEKGAGDGLFFYRYNDAGGYAGNPVKLNRANGNVELENNVVISTAGNGVDFSANTGAPGMTSELLNWYEEGVWTPVILGSGTAGTYEINTGVTKATYTRIGRVVHLSAYIVLAGAITGGGTDSLSINGVPFAKGANIPAWGTVTFSGVDFAAGANLSCYFGTTASSSTLLIWETNDNAGVTLTPISGVSAGDVIGISITYEV